MTLTSEYACIEIHYKLPTKSGKKPWNHTEKYRKYFSQLHWLPADTFSTEALQRKFCFVLYRVYNLPSLIHDVMGYGQGCMFTGLGLHCPVYPSDSRHSHCRQQKNIYCDHKLAELVEQKMGQKFEDGWDPQLIFSIDLQLIFLWVGEILAI